jgi:signal transduction histidine kinase
MDSRLRLPPLTLEPAVQKVQSAGDCWDNRDPEEFSLDAASERRSLTAASCRNLLRDNSILDSVVAVSRMAAFISHDLRQPLSAILANAEFLTRTNISEMQKIEFYQEIRWDIDRINEMVSLLLECAKGRDELQYAAQNIVYTVERAIRTTSVRQEFREITIKHHHKGRSVGWFDANRLERVFTNLVLNACEAVDPDSGQIVVTTTGSTEILQIDIWDNGPGIPSMIQDSVFQSFVSYGKQGGSGLGLVIAKKIVEDHCGTILLDPKCTKGTLFKITIPFAIPR